MVSATANNNRYDAKLLSQDVHNLPNHYTCLYEFLTNIAYHFESVVELSFPDETNMDILLCFIKNKTQHVAISFILNSIIYPDVIMLPYCDKTIPTDLSELELDGNPFEIYEQIQNHIGSQDIFDKFQTLNPDKINMALTTMSVDDRQIFPHITNTTTCGCNCSTYITLTMICKMVEKYNGYRFNGKNLTSLYYMKNLAALRICNNTQLTDITTIGYLHNLEWLRLQNCSGLKDIGPLKYLINIRAIDLDECKYVEDISPLIHLEKLIKLGIKGTMIRDTSMLLHRMMIS
jgi:hypothetical protein